MHKIYLLTIIICVLIACKDQQDKLSAPTIENLTLPQRIVPLSSMINHTLGHVHAILVISPALIENLEYFAVQFIEDQLRRGDAPNIDNLIE